jgi:hypothetical protein
MALIDLSKAELVSLVEEKEQIIAHLTVEAQAKDALLATQETEFNELMGEMQGRLSESEKESLMLSRKFGEVFIQHEAKKYRVTVPNFNVPNFGIVSAEELDTKPEVIAALLEMKSSILVEVKEA